MGGALAGGVSPLALVKVRDGMKVRSMFGLAATRSPAPEVNTDEAKGVAGLEQLVADWEQRRSHGEDVSGAVAERISTDELNELPDSLVQRVYQLLFGANGKGGGNGDTIGAAVKTEPAIGMRARCLLHNEKTLVSAAETEPHPGGNGNIDEVTAIVRTTLAELLQLTEIDDERSFMEYGLDSIAGMQLAVRLERRLKREVAPGSLISFPSVATLSKHLHP
jgi:acyl carrier protein